MSVSRLVPGSSGVPCAAYASTPHSTRAARCAYDSAFDSRVGRRWWPSTASGAHDVTGRPGRPAISSMSARGLAGDEPRGGLVLHPADAVVVTFGGGPVHGGADPGPVLRADHVDLPGAQRPGGDHGTVEHQVRRDVEQRAVLGAGRLALGSVDHDVGAATADLGPRATGPHHGLQLARQREARAAAATDLDLTEQLEQGLDPGLGQRAEAGAVGDQPGSPVDAGQQRSARCARRRWRVGGS